MCKPVYVVIAGLYLLPLLGSRERRAKLWSLAPAAALGRGGVGRVEPGRGRSVAHRRDVLRHHARSAARRHELLTAPWHFVADAVRTVPDQFWDWMKGLFGVGPSVTDWPGIVIAVAIAIFVVISIQHDGDEPRPFRWFERGLVLVLFAIGTALVFAANYVYWTTPGNDVISGIQARYFVPLLVLIPLMVGTPRGRWLGAREARFPLALLLVPLFVGFAVTVTQQMH